MDAVSISWLSLFADVPAPHLDAALRFWSAVTGAPVGRPAGERGEFIPVEPDDGYHYLWLQRIDRGTGGWHPDFHVPEPAAAAAVAEQLGAEVTIVTNALVTLSSPAGQPFCFVRPNPAAALRRPAPMRWPGGWSSRVDQICLDIPADAYDPESEFWAALTGWERPTTGLAEFERLQPPAPIAVRMLLQRLERRDRGGPRAHADLAGGDVPAEVARHLALGARVVGEFEHWTTLRDPAGLVYCVTDRTAEP